MNHTEASFRPFRYHQICRFIRTWRANGARSIKIKIGEFAQRPIFFRRMPGFTYELEEVTNVWTNTRRFYATDFMFFRWVYTIFRNAGLTNHWWEPCEIEEPIGRDGVDQFEDILPYIVISNTIHRHDTLFIWNFWDHVYMIITPKYRNRAEQNLNQNALRLVSPMGNQDGGFREIVDMPAIETDEVNFTTTQEVTQQASDQDSLPTAEELGLSLGYVSFHEENDN